VSCSENHSAIARYFRTKLAVVEVRNGESQEDAWHRYLAKNPEGARAQVKIFHYPGPSPLKKPREGSELLRFPKRENLSGLQS
jgi:hypothetical protein